MILDDQLAQPDFNVTTWIASQNIPEGNKKEAIQELLQNLETNMDALSDKFNSLHDNLKQNLPRVTSEINALQDDLEKIQPKMSSNKEGAYKEVFEKLLSLHLIVTRMEEVRACLKDQVYLFLIKGCLEHFICRNGRNACRARLGQGMLLKSLIHYRLVRSLGMQGDLLIWCRNLTTPKDTPF